MSTFRRFLEFLARLCKLFPPPRRALPLQPRLEEVWEVLLPQGGLQGIFTLAGRDYRQSWKKPKRLSYLPF